MSRPVMRLRASSLAAAALLTLAAAPAARSAPIRHEFLGVVEDSHFGDPPDGTSFRITLTYDSDLPPVASMTIGSGAAASYGFDDEIEPGPPASLRVEVDFGGRRSFTSDDARNRTITVLDNFDVPGDAEEASGPSDAFLVGVMSPHGILNFGIQDPTAEALSGAGLPLALDFSKFQGGHLVLIADNGVFIGGRITGVTPLPVPEPSALAVVALGALGLLRARRRARPS